MYTHKNNIFLWNFLFQQFVIKVIDQKNTHVHSCMRVSEGITRSDVKILILVKTHPQFFNRFSLVGIDDRFMDDHPLFFQQSLHPLADVVDHLIFVDPVSFFLAAGHGTGIPTPMTCVQDHMNFVKGIRLFRFGNNFLGIW